MNGNGRKFDFIVIRIYRLMVKTLLIISATTKTINDESKISKYLNIL